MVGDVHGCLGPLEALLEKLDVAEDDLVVFVGDLIRKRPGSLAIFRFGAEESAYYVGSADWMTRNLDRRVEAVAPVEDADLQAELDDVLSLLLEDNRRRWVMGPNGSYVQLRPEEGGPVRDAQSELMDRAERDRPADRSRPEAEMRNEPQVDLDEVYTDEWFVR